MFREKLEMHRRTIAVALAAGFLAGRGSAFASPVQAESSKDLQSEKIMKKMKSTHKAPRTLVVFYSRAGNNYVSGRIVDLTVGNTARFAWAIADKLGADCYEIKTVKSYPTDYRQTTEIAWQELDQEARPEIAGKPVDPSNYDEIYLGYPIWWGRAPRVILSYVERFDWNAKKVHLFCTHEGSGIEQSAAELREKLEGAEVDAGLSIPGHRIDECEALVERVFKR